MGVKGRGLWDSLWGSGILQMLQAAAKRNS